MDTKTSVLADTFDSGKGGDSAWIEVGDCIIDNNDPTAAIEMADIEAETMDSQNCFRLVNSPWLDKIVEAIYDSSGYSRQEAMAIARLTFSKEQEFGKHLVHVSLQCHPVNLTKYILTNGTYMPSKFRQFLFRLAANAGIRQFPKTCISVFNAPHIPRILGRVVLTQPECMAVQLYRYQQQTLSWMQHREARAHSESFSWLPFRYQQLRTVDGKPVSPLVFDLKELQMFPRATRAMEEASKLHLRIPGGILADQMGLGKTVASIALVADELDKLKKRGAGAISTVEQRIADAMRADNTVPRFKTHATLIVCPSHICSQWMNEFRNKVKDGKSLKICLIGGKVQHVKQTYRDWLEADVVIVSMDFLKNRQWYQSLPQSLDESSATASASAAGTEDSSLDQRIKTSELSTLMSRMKEALTGVADESGKKPIKRQRKKKSIDDPIADAGVEVKEVEDSAAAAKAKTKGTRRKAPEKRTPKALSASLTEKKKVKLQKDRMEFWSEYARKRLARIQTIFWAMQTKSQPIADIHAPYLEHFQWRRLILDEAHESLGKSFNSTFEKNKSNAAFATDTTEYSEEAELLCNIDADYRWYVSGTPLPFDKLSLRGFLRFSKATINGAPAVPPQYRREKDDLMGHADASQLMRFIYDYCYARTTKASSQQDAFVPDYEEEVINCTFSQVEQAMYKAIENSMHVLDRRLQLRQLCCHPQISDQAAMDLGSTEMMSLDKIRDGMIAAEKARLKSYLDQLVELRREVATRRFEYTELSRSTYASQQEVRNSKARLKTSEQNVKDTEIIVGNVQKTIDFFVRTIPKSKDEVKERECDICMDKIEEMAVLPCAHIFCKPCINNMHEAHVTQNGGVALSDNTKLVCPNCRGPFALTDIRMCNVLEQDKSEGAKQALPMTVAHQGYKILKDLPKLINRFGTKMAHMMRRIADIFEADDTNHIIIFSQWDKMLSHVGESLERIGIPHVFCAGNIHSKNKSIARFTCASGERLDKVRVMLLSLDHAASGTNLTVANYIFLLDPMDGTTHQEMQAIKRSHRQGQTRKLTVIRMIMTGTVEEEIAASNREKQLQHRQTSVEAEELDHARRAAQSMEMMEQKKKQIAFDEKNDSMIATSIHSRNVHTDKFWEEQVGHGSEVRPKHIFNAIEHAYDNFSAMIGAYKPLPIEEDVI